MTVNKNHIKMKVLIFVSCILVASAYVVSEEEIQEQPQKVRYAFAIQWIKQIMLECKLHVLRKVEISKFKCFGTNTHLVQIKSKVSRILSSRKCKKFHY